MLSVEKLDLGPYLGLNGSLISSKHRLPCQRNGHQTKPLIATRIIHKKNRLLVKEETNVS